jgi:hypothetical protein
MEYTCFYRSFIKGHAGSFWLDPPAMKTKDLKKKLPDFSHSAFWKMDGPSSMKIGSFC